MLEKNRILLVFPVKENQRVPAEAVREFFPVLFEITCISGSENQFLFLVAYRFLPSFLAVVT